MLLSQRLPSQIALLLFPLALLPALAQDAPSGRPDVIIPGKTAKAVLGVISNELLNQSYTIRSRSEFNAVFEKPLEGAVKFMLSGPGLAPPVYRITFDFLETDAQTRVVGDRKSVV